MKKNLEILGIDDRNEDGTPKTTRKGIRYTRFKTSDGWMSCFDLKSCEMLKGFEGKVACVEVTQSGDFKNIQRCYGDGAIAEGISEAFPNGKPERPEDHSNFQEDTYDPKPEVVKIGVTPETMAKPKNGRNPYDKDPVGLVIDLIVSGMSYSDAVKTVKQAKEAFE